MSLPPGKYHTAAGSTLEVSGKHAGIFTLDFDWVEELACCECVADPVPDDGDLVWHCQFGDGGRAKWIPDDAS